MKYFLQRQKNFGKVNLPNSSFGFVTCNALTGIGLGRFYSFNCNVLPRSIVVALGPIYYTKKVYENLLNELLRSTKLSLFLAKEYLTKSNTKTLNESTDQGLNGLERSKRKALNNGIFKPNDTY